MLSWAKPLLSHSEGHAGIHTGWQLLHQGSQKTIEYSQPDASALGILPCNAFNTAHGMAHSPTLSRKKPLKNETRKAKLRSGATEFPSTFCF